MFGHAKTSYLLTLKNRLSIRKKRREIHVLVRPDSLAVN
jgi:hypothetical protein